MMDVINGIVGDARQKYVEEQKEMDRLVAEKLLSPKQKKIAAMAGDKEKIDAEDFAALRAGKKVAKEETEVDEATLSAKAARAGKDIGKPGKNFGKIAASAAKRYGSEEAGKRVAGAVLKKMRANEEVEQTNEAAERDTPGQHMCAVHVKHSSFGEGRTLYSQHADPDAEGLIEWYDVMFEHGIEKKVPTTDLEILEACSHSNHKKGK